MKKETITVTTFRANIYALIDEIGKTGEPKLLLRNNEVYEIRKKSAKKPQKPKKYRDLSKIVSMKVMVEDPDWYISPKLHEWNGEIDPKNPPRNSTMASKNG